MPKVNQSLGCSKVWLAIAVSIVFYQFCNDLVEAAPRLIAEPQAESEVACPNKLDELVDLLLQDLPAYSNRVIQRTQTRNQAAGIENYIITAGRAEYQPLDLPRLQYDPIDDRDPEQVFFTVLERQYLSGRIVEIETYHWLFLTLTDSGWRPVMLFSRFGNSADNKPPAPPRETTNGIIGRGIQLWLRDCRANAST